jgi:hypothetical protein
MAERINPMAGPAYIEALRNALEQRSTAICAPPRTGGKQVSIRLDDFLLDHIEALAELSNWNRSEVLYTVAHQGLLALYTVSPTSAEAAVAKIMEKFKGRHHLP